MMNEENKTVVDSFVPDYVSDIKRYFVEKLAKILSECVEYKGISHTRNKVDQYISKNYVSNTISRNDFILLTKEFLILTVYSELKKHQNLPEINLDSIIYKLTYQDRYKDEINRITEIINKLPYDDFKYLINELNSFQRNEYRDKFLGKEVWDRGYQTIQKTDILKNKGYGKIIFY